MHQPIHHPPLPVEDGEIYRPRLANSQIYAYVRGSRARAERDDPTEPRLHDLARPEILGDSHGQTARFSCAK
jgi:hypothetical protein